MIRFMMVQGHVVVDDVRNGYREMARSGQELDDNGNFLIVTAPGSKADIMINGKTLSLGASSFMRVSRDRTWMGRHYASWTRDLKTFVGKIWYRIAGDKRDPDPPGNVAVGVRG